MFFFILFLEQKNSWGEVFEIYKEPRNKFFYAKISMDFDNLR